MVQCKSYFTYRRRWIFARILFSSREILMIKVSKDIFKKTQKDSNCAFCENRWSGGCTFRSCFSEFLPANSMLFFFFVFLVKFDIRKLHITLLLFVDIRPFWEYSECCKILLVYLSFKRNIVFIFRHKYLFFGKGTLYENSNYNSVFKLTIAIRICQ